ncbi:HAD family hydrolase [Chryseobacterium balustinum]|uniref:Haloacid dehalogenase superfamily, subfamily IA, variant 3 with third motif having DD or ED/haloacid dehalogenase superfamily, subfamily IA, variant 1 with third motif having Dx(3-4)D or Dx(3-4)E n=1 Tax=Chryseobacterium balustinum TaxID=246 RepID=A0AAX2IS95_9FLAO|nr:HAD family phosphatase [Chryseobacterium balustinum]AZB28422.1 HAD family phosphatase [Chryseobacterium balustinum]SKC04155.1 haloacid dehalogenase superfamily, subfamily IA, variant 3 with third motif having DD or ED/haloacid dehalogenase superfamily, subfamily IA, variant 1 with third motif having Dx(3-4)D or Dx(3-4)E [Chryseobacterium balustinum]SQA92610.1 Phosphorylated carbohydrates phosphatase TM_1254 [Chryseobacterium balustinum]
MTKNRLDLKAIIFDMDGVLINTEPQYENFWRTSAKKYNVYFEGFEKQIRGMTVKKLFEGHFKHIGDVEKKNLLKEFKAFEDKMSFPEISGISSLLYHLKQAKIKLGLVTSSDLEKLTRVSGQKNYDLYFDVMITANDVVDGKPAPECYLKAADKLGVEPENCIVFEDSFAGISAAKSAGMVVVGVSSSHSKNELMSECENVVVDFRRTELKDIIKFYKS